MGVHLQIGKQDIQNFDKFIEHFRGWPERMQLGAVVWSVQLSHWRAKRAKILLPALHFQLQCVLHEVVVAAEPKTTQL
jgi:hypothetical protein